MSLILALQTLAVLALATLLAMVFLALISRFTSQEDEGLTTITPPPLADEPHPPTRHCDCPACAPSFED